MSSASPAAPTCRPTTRSTTPTSPTSKRATSRAPDTPPRATRRPLAGWGSPSRPRDPARRIWSPRSPTRCWTRCRPCSSPGQVRTDLIGTDGFQEADVTGITLPIVKHSFLVTDPRQIPEYIHAAFHIASTGSPGPGAGRRPAGPLARRHRVRAGRGAAQAARLQAAHRGQHQADQAGRQGDRQRPPAGDLLRWRGDQRQRVAGADRVRHRGQVPGHADGDGARRLSGAARPVARDAGHARHPDRQLRDGQRRPDPRDRRPLRRSDHRQALGVRAAGQVRPRRRRPGGDLQERPRPHPDRRRRQGRAREADPRVPGPEGGLGAARRLVEAASRLADGVPAGL